MRSPSPFTDVSALSTEQALALAPDASSAKAGQGLASPHHWQTLGADDRALWGLCKGSGKLPYQTRIDRSDWATRCSCPSRKFPCKHALALLLLHASQPDAMTETIAPAYVEEWLTSRRDRAEMRVEREARPAADPVATAKAAERREAKRDERIGAGLAELKQWIEDLIDAGLANAPIRDTDFWDQRARRLVDAQAPGMARSVASVHALTNGDRWFETVLAELSLLHLACEAFARGDGLGEATRADLERYLGLPLSADRLDPANAVEDDWLCVGSQTEELDRLRVLRTWLRGAASEEDALLLSFAPLTQPLPAPLPPNSLWRGRVVFYPGSVRQRAQLQEGAERRSFDALPFQAPTIVDSLERCTAASALDPWLRLQPMWVQGRIALSHGQFWLVDAAGDGLPLGNAQEHAWHLFAASLGKDQHWFGEWNGRQLQLMRGWATA